MPASCRSAALVALAAVFAAFAAQAFTIRRNFGGDWTALFVTGDKQTLPVGLEARRFRDTRGYDGQYYRLLAHDPLLLLTPQEIFDAPRMRWRRILVPALAHLGALRRRGWIDAAYIAVVLSFLGLGVYWCARWCDRAGLSPGWGLLFGLAPGVTISLERMTVDIALAALAAGFVVTRQAGGASFWLIVAAAPLARETGAVLPLACAAEASLARNGRRLAAAVAAGLPGLAWYGWTYSRTRSDQVAFFDAWPFEALAARTFDVSSILAAAGRDAVAAALDHVALLGVWAALALSVVLLRRRPWTATEWALALFCAFPVLLSYGGVWAEAYAFARVFTPLLVWLALAAVARRRGVYLTPLALTAPRIVTQLAPHLLGDGRGWS